MVGFIECLIKYYNTLNLRYSQETIYILTYEFNTLR